MTITPELKQAVTQAVDNPVRAEDPETHTAYVVFKEEGYLRIMAVTDLPRSDRSLDEVEEFISVGTENPGRGRAVESGVSPRPSWPLGAKAAEWTLGRLSWGSPPRGDFQDRMAGCEQKNLKPGAPDFIKRTWGECLSAFANTQGGVVTWERSRHHFIFRAAPGRTADQVSEAAGRGTETCPRTGPPISGRGTEAGDAEPDDALVRWRLRPIDGAECPGRRGPWRASRGKRARGPRPRPPD